MSGNPVTDDATDLAAFPHSAGAGRRLVYVDGLRLIAVIGVFVIHVCEVFNPWDEWHVTNVERSRIAGEIVVVMAPWIMPLFIALAGVSAWYSLGRRTNGAYLRDRVRRLLLPLAVGVPLLVLPQVYLERRFRGQYHGTIWSFVPHFFEGIYPQGNLSWHHLWFLAHLMLYALIALPLFRYMQREAGHAQLDRLARLSGGRWGLLWLALPLILERHLLWGLFPERHMLTSDWSNHALLFVAYVYGFVLAGEPWLGAAIDAQWTRALAVAVITTALVMAGMWVGLLPGGLPAPYSLSYLLFWTLYAVGAWAWMVAVLGAGRRWLTHENRLLGYCRQAGYGWYLVHQPIIVALTVVIAPLHQSVAVKFPALFALSALGTLAAGELLRRTPGVRAVLG